jgi:hypothetical protein
MTAFNSVSVLLHILGHPSYVGAVGHGGVVVEIDLIPYLYAFGVSCEEKKTNRHHLMEENDQTSLD